MLFSTESYPMKLSQLADNVIAKVKRVDTYKDFPEICQQLADIGFMPGEMVTILRRNHFGGDPLVVRIGLSTFALRKQEAELVEVEDYRSHG